MATTATTQWWIRTDGNDANGGGYDATTASAGTNYSDQAAAQASWSNLHQASGGTITDDSTTGLATAAMIGNVIQVSGQGYYLITAVPDANTLTVTPCTNANATFTAGKSGKVGGAFRNPSNLSNGGAVTAPTTSSPLAPGNIVNVRAGGGSVGSPDYSQTGYAQYPSGDTTNGYVAWQAYNGTPYIVTDGLTWWNFGYHKWVGIYCAASGTNISADGIYGANTAPWVLINCTVDANNKAIHGFGTTNNQITLIGCTLKGGGTTSLVGFNSSIYGNVLKNCTITGWGSDGVKQLNSASPIHISTCAICLNTGCGVNLQSSSIEPTSIVNCTIDGNGSDGVQLSGVACSAWTTILNNNITGNGGYGINCAAGTAAANDAAIMFADYNNYGASPNTMGNYHNISAGAHDLSVDPGYAGGGDYTPSNSLLIAAAPVPFA